MSTQPGWHSVKERVLRAVLHTRAGRRARGELMAVENLMRLLEIFDRPRWLYRSRGVIPRVEVHYRTPLPVSESDVDLCRRLIDAWWLARADAPDSSGMWTHDIFRDRQRQMVHALEHRDPRLLAERLAAMMRSEAIQGMALGSLGVTTMARLSTGFSRLWTLNKLVALAESQGAVEAECPEHAVGVAFANGVGALMANIESALGVRPDFPDVGAAYGIRLAGCLITADTPDQLYAAARLRQAARVFLADRRRSLHVVEIGGGYGGMVYWLAHMLDARYTIVDLPIVGVLQGYFLSQALGHAEVSFYGEEPRRVVLVPSHSLATIQAPFDLLVNKDSMPEIPLCELVGYLKWARESCGGIFYSYNQETRTPYDGTPQNVVPDVLADIGGFTLIRRDASWLRRGYVEEIYEGPQRAATAPSPPFGLRDHAQALLPVRG
jgi:hypothetical protein